MGGRVAGGAQEKAAVERDSGDIECHGQPPVIGSKVVTSSWSLSTRAGRAWRATWSPLTALATGWLSAGSAAASRSSSVVRSEEHTSELQSLMRISYAVFC